MPSPKNLKFFFGTLTVPGVFISHKILVLFARQFIQLAFSTCFTAANGQRWRQCFIKVCFVCQFLDKRVDRRSINIHPHQTIRIVIGRTTQQTNCLAVITEDLPFNFLETKWFSLPACNVRILACAEWCERPIKWDEVKANFSRS